MSVFEFLMVLISIIIGLGLTEILGGTARCFRHRDTAQIYWIHAFLAVLLFILLLQQWWEIWEDRHTPEWTFPGVIMMMSGPIGLFLMAHLIFPEQIAKADFEAYYYGAMKPIFWIGIATAIAATLFRPLVFGHPLISLDNLSTVFGVAGFATLALSNQRKLHHVLIPVLTVTAVLDVVLADFAIS